MEKENKLNAIINLFEGKEIRSIWDSEKEDYYFSVVDIISVLTDSAIPKRYWTDLKRKLVKEGSELYENIVQLKIKSSKDASDYWTTLKRRLSKEEGSEIPTKCRILKMKSIKDGKNYPTDTLDTV